MDQGEIALINVDIYVPFLNRTYDFNLDDQVSVATVIEETVGMICQRERWPAPENARTLTLSSPRLGRIMRAGETLWEAGIRTGNRLILC